MGGRRQLLSGIEVGKRKNVFASQGVWVWGRGEGGGGGWRR